MDGSSGAAKNREKKGAMKKKRKEIEKRGREGENRGGRRAVVVKQIWRAASMNVRLYASARPCSHE